MATDSSQRSAFFSPAARLPDDVEVRCVEEASSESGVAYLKVEYLGLSGWVKKAYLTLPEPAQAMEGSSDSEESDEEDGERPACEHTSPTLLACLTDILHSMCLALQTNGAFTTSLTSVSRARRSSTWSSGCPWASGQLPGSRLRTSRPTW